jgi:KaiC/GvpD/RAD55 family RecA-like ATPase
MTLRATIPEELLFDLRDLDAERAVIGAVMVDNAAFATVATTIRSEHFSAPGNRLAWEAAARLAAHDIAIDPVTVAEELDRAGKLDEAGGRASIAAYIDAVPVSAHAGYYAEIVRRKAYRRTICARSLDLIHAATNGHADEDLAREVSAFPEAVALHAADADDLQFADLAAPLPAAPLALVGKDGSVFIPTGQKVAIVADSGVGKTHLLVALAVGLVSESETLGFSCRGCPVLYVSSDDDPDLIRKFQRHAAGRGMSTEELAALPLRVLNDPAFNLDLPGTVAKVRKALRALGADKHPALLIVESLTTNIDPAATDLNSGPSVRSFIRRTVSTLQAEFPSLTTILSHHLKKTQQGSGNDMGSRIAHSVQIKAGVDVAFGLSAAGDESFTVRTLKRSRSGAKVEPFRVRIVGAPDASLTLVHDGNLKPSDEEVSGAAKAVLAFLAGNPGPRSVKEILVGTTGVKKRAIERAAAKLTEGPTPRLAGC